jgi:CRISPR-associated protein Cas4
MTEERQTMEEDNQLKELVTKTPEWEIDAPLLGRGTFHANDMGSCARMIYYQFVNAKEDEGDEEDNGLVMEWGNRAHELVGQLFKNAGILLAEEYRIESPQYRFSGRIDFIIKHRKKIMPVEVKSVNDKAFHLYAKPSKHHVVQLQSYLWLGNWDEGRLVYFCRDCADLLILKVAKDDTIIQQIKNTISLVNTAVANVVPPMKEKGWRCRYCSYTKTCEKDG